MTIKKASPLIALMFGNFKKVSSLIAFILGISVATVSAQEFPKNLGIPKRFENYQTKGYMLASHNIYINEYFLHVQPYSLGEYGKPDVEEVYEILGSNKNGNIMNISEHPLFYNFDLNNNGKFEDEEILMDEKGDGLNGNEEWLWMMKKRMMEEGSSKI